MTSKGAGLAELRKEFPAHHISKLPKETRAQIDARKTDRNVMVFNCEVCGGHHHKNAVHLDYVGHAALTDRLLDTDIEWSWEPVAFNADGLPAFDRNNGLWIKLTVCGVTRLGYGSADGKAGGDAVKEIIGDALRNAAMRFGAALDLWHKGDLHISDDEGGTEVDEKAEANERINNPKGREPTPRAEKWEGAYSGKSALHKGLTLVDRNIRGCGDSGELEAYLQTQEYKDFVWSCEKYSPHYLTGGDPCPVEFIGITELVERMRSDFTLIENSTLRAG